MTVGDLKRRLANKLQTTDVNIRVYKDSNELIDNKMVLSQHGMHENTMFKLDFHSPIRYRQELKNTSIVNFKLPENHGKRNAISNHTSIHH